MFSEEPSGLVAVTGATGALGSRVAARLAQRGVPMALVARDPSRLPALVGAEHRGPAGYGDDAAMRGALEGVRTLFLVSGGLSPRRFEEHACAIDAAVACGVQYIVYVSLVGAAEHATFAHSHDHWQTEQYLAASPVRWTVLRPSIYASMLTARADEQGVIRGPAGDGRFAAVDHDDIADVAAEVLAPGPSGPRDVDAAILEITGPEAVTMGEAAEQLTRATGRHYVYEPESVEDAIAWRSRTDDPHEVERWISWFQAIAKGEFGSLTDVVPAFTGHRASTVAESVARRQAQR
ncbi:NAD(P)H-binding protein [Streptosporangium lutulentum]|uniref:Uncharacterized protein YbjT (DUF2867 family) n=1 Tax=Streptosporangium lutulentum TaxID=1461250 RepID=A0ABT9QPV1_9ACTN|nr:NAD(P)H-binding protein [Streptosporangium lutulentum]MDP9848789.1 uncharacterized protein YbjT (DUF2867 family) [Streptosporangium lutulentum]